MVLEGGREREKVREGEKGERMGGGKERDGGGTARKRERVMGNVRRNVTYGKSLKSFLQTRLPILTLGLLQLETILRILLFRSSMFG